MGTATAIIASAVISAGSAAYQADQQKQIADDQQRKRDKAAADAKAEADRIAQDTRPTGQSVKEIKFGSSDSHTNTGSTQDFLIPKTSALGTSSSGRSGLGFLV